MLMEEYNIVSVSRKINISRIVLPILIILLGGNYAIFEIPKF